MPILAHSRFVRGGVLTLALGIIAVGGMTWLGTRMWIVTSVTTEVTSQELKAALLGGGLSPTKLAAAGVNSGAATTLVGNAREYLNDNPGELSAAQAAVISAQANVERLERLVQQGQATEPDITALATARSTLTTALSNRSTKLAAFIAAAEDGLSETPRARLATIRGNAGINLHVKYLVCSKTSEDWVALRDAVASCATRAKFGETADPACEGVVAAANADSATTTAAQALNSNLSSVTSAFNAAVDN